MEVRNPGALAASVEIDLERFRHAGTLVRMPATMSDLARTLGKVAVNGRSGIPRRTVHGATARDT